MNPLVEPPCLPRGLCSFSFHFCLRAASVLPVTLALRLFCFCTSSSVVFASAWLSLPALSPVFSFPCALVGELSWAVMSQAKTLRSWSFFLHLTLYKFCCWIREKLCLAKTWPPVIFFYRGNAHISYLKLSIQVFIEDRRGWLCPVSVFFAQACIHPAKLQRSKVVMVFSGGGIVERQLCSLI